MKKSFDALRRSGRSRQATAIWSAYSCGDRALLRGDACHLRGVLVDSGQEERFDATLTLVADKDVRRDRRVRVPDVRVEFT
jgi:hypothetical protein